MSVESLIASYLRLASNDMEDAKLIHTRRSRNAIYHCEQAAEKVIKAVLTSEGLLRRSKRLISCALSWTNFPMRTL